ncbi:hypothetical protein AVEN_181859-1 [Araneus ventricosus]|uniref:Uncharacterized protein n=1 Tax=Araneus ventricosus TaxID=182803 RepID=A0A4Y2RSR0_ARAVE|nr:hypothetical protein AVEN_181859-1 [Araneus ventricosus]
MHSYAYYYPSFPKELTDDYHRKSMIQKRPFWGDGNKRIGGRMILKKFVANLSQLWKNIAAISLVWSKMSFTLGSAFNSMRLTYHEALTLLINRWLSKP